MQKIHQTEDYTLFKRILGNRKMSQPHINRLIDAISQDASVISYNPIVVNEKYEVVDGQHRLEAIKKLGLPVHYIQEEGLTLANVQSLNAMSKVWSPMDYARSYSELGNKNYKLYIDFKIEFKLNHDVLRAFLSLDKPTTVEMFRHGMFKVPSVDKSWDLCACHREVGEYYERYKLRSFALAFKRIWENNEYNHKRMLDKLSKFGHKIEDYSLVEDYQRALENVYNHGVPADKRVRLF